MTWQLLRFWIRLRRGRLPPWSLPDPIWYFAYGSNMNERLFRERRHMTPIETRPARLDGYRPGSLSRVDGNRASGLLSWISSTALTNSPRVDESRGFRPP